MLPVWNRVAPPCSMNQGVLKLSVCYYSSVTWIKPLTNQTICAINSLANTKGSLNPNDVVLKQAE